MDLKLTIRIFLIITAVFFPVFWYFCYLWTERKELTFQNLFGTFTAALLNIFKMILLGAVLIFIISIIVNFI